MGIKDFQQLNICCDDGDQVSLISSFQLRRTEGTQSGKHLMADDCQQLKRDKVIAVLFHIMKHTSKNRKDNQKDKDSRKRNSVKQTALQLHRHL